MRRPPSTAAVLLEALVSLAVFLGVAAFVLAASRQSLEAARASALEARGTDLARSALAAIDAGLVPVSALDGGDRMMEAIGFLDPEGEADPFAPDTGRWTLDVAIDPSDLADLSLATVTATWVPPGTEAGPGGGGGFDAVAGGAGAGAAGGFAVPGPERREDRLAVTLRGLVRLADAEAWAPEDDDLLEGLPEAEDVP